MNENFEPEFTENNGTPNEAPTVEPIAQPKENTLAGIVGALLFSLAGGIVWFLLYQVGFLAAISGIIGVVCAIKGYAIFGKRESVKGIIISTVIAFLVIIAAWYLCLSYELYKTCQDSFANGELDFTLTFAESVRGVYPILVEDTEIAISCLKDLAIGLIFCVIGAFGYVKAAIGKVKNK